MGIGARQIVTSHSLVPFWDEWTEIDAIATAPHHQLPLSWLWSQHNEHRVVFYRLLLLADIHMFHGKHWISFWCMLAVQILFLVCLAWMLHFCGVKGTLWRAIVGLGGFALFCPAQWENFSWAFQISFLLPGFFLLLAVSAWVRIRTPFCLPLWRDSTIDTQRPLQGLAYVPCSCMAWHGPGDGYFPQFGFEANAQTPPKSRKS